MNPNQNSPVTADDASPTLVRGLSLKSATALNMIDMIGVGPFITIPLIISAMGGPQAMLGWIFGAVLLAVFRLDRKITIIGRFSMVLWVGVIVTIAWVIFAGLTHFNAGRAFDFPPNAFHLDNAFFTGLGAALLVSTYDYWGYYNV